MEFGKKEEEEKGVEGKGGLEGGWEGGGRLGREGGCWRQRRREGFWKREI